MAKGFKTGGRKKGSKNKKTLEEEEMREILRQKASEQWGPIIDELIVSEKKYVVDQVIGKPTERVEVSGEIGFNFDEVS